ARVNLSLAVFNLLPIPPLDGSRIFSSFLPLKWTVWIDRYHEYVRMFVLLLIVTGILDKPLLFLTGAVGNGVCMLFGLPQLF
ncbi:MAG: site-2 protease family protein, partial [Clostridia bacterium]|nr:site-2 protease family protein [Clostridia bacterium]